MARRPRIIIPGQPLHVTHRGNNRSDVFGDVEDLTTYMSLLREESENRRCDVHSYVFMTNHFHLLMTPNQETSMSKLMHAVGTRFALYYNRKYGRTGTVWEGRPHSFLIDSTRYFFDCLKYIELNPVRARMVSEPSAYAWSSFQCNALGLPDALVTPHALYQSLADSSRGRQLAYQALFKNDLDPEVCAAIRTATISSRSLLHQLEINRVEAACARESDRSLPV